eukprot:PhM_4_TR8289/c2_g1_i1/m.92578
MSYEHNVDAASQRIASLESELALMSERHVREMEDLHSATQRREDVFRAQLREFEFEKKQWDDERRQLLGRISILSSSRSSGSQPPRRTSSTPRGRSSYPQTSADNEKGKGGVSAAWVDAMNRALGEKEQRLSHVTSTAEVLRRALADVRAECVRLGRGGLFDRTVGAAVVKEIGVQSTTGKSDAKNTQQPADKTPRNNVGPTPRGSAPSATPTSTHSVNHRHVVPMPLWDSPRSTQRDRSPQRPSAKDLAGCPPTSAPLDASALLRRAFALQAESDALLKTST